MVFTSTDISFKNLDTPKPGNLQPSVKVQMKACSIKCGSGMRTFAAINCLRSLGIHTRLLLSLMVHDYAVSVPVLPVCWRRAAFEGLCCFVLNQTFQQGYLVMYFSKVICFSILIEAIHRTPEKFP